MKWQPICSILSCLFLFELSCFAKVSQADMTRFSREATPWMFGPHSIWDSPENLRAFVIRSLKAANALPANANDAGRCISRQSDAWLRYVAYVRGQKPVDVEYFRGYFKDDNRENCFRPLTAHLLYIETGSESYILSALQQSPVLVQFFAKVKDAQFDSIMQSIIRGVAGEEAVCSLRSGADTSAPFTAMLRTGYADFVRASLFQTSDPRMLEFLFARYSRYRAANPFPRDVEPSGFVSTLKGGPDGTIEIFIKSLVKAEAFDDLTSFKTDCPALGRNIDQSIDTYANMLQSRLDLCRTTIAGKPHVDK